MPCGGYPFHPAAPSLGWGRDARSKLSPLEPSPRPALVRRRHHTAVEPSTPRAVTNVWVFPVLLGSGKRLFAEGTVPTALRLVESATFPRGAVHLTYERAGQPTFGSMA